MCRLYAMHANEPTKVECGLVIAQNALMAQSRSDMSGHMHGHGWGVADYPDGTPLIEKQTWAAFHGEHFAKKAARVYAKTVIAHARRATVGGASLENTHPFVYGRYVFAHNGTLPNFDRIQPLLLQGIDPVHRNHIQGQTDSEHIFMYLMTLWSHRPQVDLLATVREGLERIVTISQQTDPEAPIGLNIVLSDGEELVGARLNRSLWSLRRDHVHDCETCGKRHVHHHEGMSYRSLEVASEPVTHTEPWTIVENGTAFRVGQDFRLETKRLRLPEHVIRTTQPEMQ